MTAQKPAARDRTATERAILDAARDILAEEGFPGFGVNAIARRAGCDKQLIYRYFDGTGGLIDGIGKGIAEDLRARLDPLLADGPPASYGAFVARLATGFLAAFRASPLLQKIKAWEVSSPSPEVARLSAARAAALGAWIAAARGPLAPPEGTDAPALNAVLIAAIEGMVLSAAATGSHAGLPLREEADWQRAEAALRRIVAAVYP